MSIYDFCVHAQWDIKRGREASLHVEDISGELVELGGRYCQAMSDEGFLSFVPVTNSALLFDSRLWHRGMGPSRVVDGMRITVAWKLSV